MYDIFLKLLEEMGVTTAEVCKATGIAQSTISNWKKRGNPISPENGLLIADYFGIPLERLYRGTEDISYEYMAQQLFEGHLRLEGYEVEFDNPAEGKPCEECLSRGEIDGTPWWAIPDSSDPGRMCEKCLLNDLRYVVTKDNQSHSFTMDEYRSMIARTQYTAICAVTEADDDPEPTPLLKPESRKHLAKYDQLSDANKAEVGEVTDKLFDAQIAVMAAHKRADAAVSEGMGKERDIDIAKK